MNPLAAAWFKPTATVMLERTRGYLDLLTLHGVAWEETRAIDPGRLVYEDRYQVVAVPGPAGRSEGPLQLGPDDIDTRSTPPTSTRGAA